VDSRATTNFCKTEEMSFCAVENMSQQPDCNYYEKARHANRCMYFIFEKYCDCLNAQLNCGMGCTPST